VTLQLAHTYVDGNSENKYLRILGMKLDMIVDVAIRIIGMHIKKYA